MHELSRLGYAGCTVAVSWLLRAHAECSLASGHSPAFPGHLAEFLESQVLRNELVWVSP